MYGLWLHGSVLRGSQSSKMRYLKQRWLGIVVMALGGYPVFRYLNPHGMIHVTRLCRPVALSARELMFRATRLCSVLQVVLQ